MRPLTRRMLFTPATGLAACALSWLSLAALPPAATAEPPVAAVQGCDIDGDGFGDLVVGAAREGGADTGRLFVRFGSPSGPGDRGQELVPPYNDQRWFGTTMTCGDFDDDGYDDLVVGAWGATIGKATGAGAVFLYYGAAEGADINRISYLREGTSLPGKPQDFDFLGNALSVGDFDGDGVDDLAIGVPHEHVRVDEFCCGTVGAVYELHGVAGEGLDSATAKVWTQNSPGVPGKVQKLDDFGETLAAGDFDGDGCDDLAVGTPNEATAGHRYVGVVTVLPGSAAGLTGNGATRWSQASDGVKGEPEKADRFGRTLAAGDLAGGPQDDLAIAVGDAGGSVHVLPGSTSGLTATGSTLWSQSTPGVPGDVAHRDGFGFKLAIADVNGDGHRDLTVVTRHEDNGAGKSPGAVTTLLGTATGISGEGATRVTAAQLHVPTSRATTYFGYGFAVLDTGATRPTVVVGAPKADPAMGGAALVDAGVVALLPGGPRGLSADTATLLTEDDSAWSNATAAAEWFGSGIAS